jgi:hypothetical protein
MKTRNKIILIIGLLWLSPTICAALYAPINIVKTLIQSSMGTVYNDLIDTSLPGGGDSPAEADDNMRRIQAGFQEILAVEHNVDLTGTVITGDATHTNITTDSIVNAGTMTTGSTLGVTGDFAVNTDKFTVTAASGNTLVAGTLDVTDETTLTGGLAATTMSGALAMGSNEITGLDAGDASGDAVHFGQWKFNNVAAATPSGGNDSIGSTTSANGVITKWGSIAKSSTDTTVTFATAFPTACFQAIACAGNDTGTNNSDTTTHTITAASFKIRNTNFAVVDEVRWFAVGR